jgi:hypothetical protein
LEELLIFFGIKTVPSEATPTSFPILSRNVKMTMMLTFETRREVALPVCLKDAWNLFKLIGLREKNYIIW